ncbi:MAG TPA: PQQ-binding-like beta-propeller repeat protein, partial [Ktedonosporobacter sp.]|nr:PQQ-binding-like beta-propeller repeat protein [Ktedonosporobacter sp.]
LTFNTPKQEATLRSYDGKDGHQRWELQASWGAQLFVCNDSVYLIGLQSLRAYSVQDGHLLWQQVGDFFVYSRFSQIVSRKALVFIQNGLDIDALSAQTGKPLWRHSYPQDGHFVPVSVAVSDQAVYVLNASYDTAGMYQIEKLSLGNGQPFWSTTPFHFPSDGTFFSSIVVENGMVYIQATAGATNSLVAFDARSGKLAWQNASVLEVRILHGKSMSRNRAKQGSVHTKVPLTRRSGVAILSGVIVLLL